MKKSYGIRRRWLVQHVGLMALFVLVSVVVASVAISRFYYSYLQDGLTDKLKTTSDFFAHYAFDSEDAFHSAVYGLTQNYEQQDSMKLEFLNTDGEIVSTAEVLEAGTRPQTSDVSGALETLEISAFRGRDPGTNERILAVSGPMYFQGELAGVLRFVTDLHPADRHILFLVCLVVLGAVVVILLIFLTGIYFIHSIVTPVAEITETAKRIAAGGYGVQIQKKFAEGNDEIGELARSINNVSLQISQTEKMQTEFLSSVSHELRTPLTAISGWGETLLTSENMDPGETRRGIITMLKETRRLTSLVEELLDFTRIQDGRFKINVEPCDIRGVFEDTIFMYGSRLKQEGIELVYQETEEEIPEISGDPERLKQVFLNILDNAAKYGGEGGKILCAIHQGEQEVCVTIRDFGPGIPEEELPLVKKKFYKGSAKGRGSGIGLAVCEEIVTVHGGTLDIQNAKDEAGGCQVTIHLPI